MIRILMGINIINNGIFPFFFWRCSHLQLLVILAAAAFVNSPGEIFIADFCHSSQLSTKEFPGAPGASQLSPEGHAKNGGLPGVWEFGNANQDPGNLKDDPGSKINGGFPGVWEIRVRSLTLRARRPGKLSTGYPRDILSREFGSLSLVSLWLHYISYHTRVYITL